MSRTDKVIDSIMEVFDEHKLDMNEAINITLRLTTGLIVKQCKDHGYSEDKSREINRKLADESFGHSWEAIVEDDN